MSFREFTANVQSIREYKESQLEEHAITDIIAYLREINAGIGSEKGFYFVVLENGQEVFQNLEGIGGYSGIMIKSPHYIALSVLEEKPESEFYGAYYMQSVVKKLYEMNLGSCWINTRNISHELKSRLLKENAGTMNYLLAFGIPADKGKQNPTRTTVVNASSTFKQDPYGTKVIEPSESDKARVSLGELVYLHEWGKQAAYEELETRGMADIFFYVRNAPSYKNIQPCRFILKNGEADLAILSPDNKENYVDAGIMMYTFEGLAKESGIPIKWQFIGEETNDEHGIAAKIDL